MEGLYLLIGHLIGDYIVQNDWMATNKTNGHPGKEPYPQRSWLTARDSTDEPEGLPQQREWWKARDKWWTGHLACTVHCLCYTLAVWACSFWWMPWWGVALTFALHWPIDRFRLAGRWMRNVSGQSAFASGMLSPWSIIVVDNIGHLATLAGIAALCGR